MRHIVLLLAALAGSLPLVSPAAGAPPVEGVAKARHDLRLGFTVPGRVARVLVQPGDRVDAAQPVIELDDAEGEALLALYGVRAASDLEIQAAEAQKALAEVEEGRVRESFSRGAAAPFEVERAQLETRRAVLTLEQARQRKLEAEHQLAQARARHDAFTLRAPISGVVEEVLVSAGETVQELKPVIRIVATNPLRVDAPVRTEETLTLEVGAPAWVWTDAPGQTAPVEGRVIYLAQVADAASDTRLVRVEVPNDKGLPAGRLVRVAFTRPEATATAE